MKTPAKTALIKEMLSQGEKPVRLQVRNSSLFGIVIEGHNGLPIGGAFKSLEKAHEAHSRAWHAAWDNVA